MAFEARPSIEHAPIENRVVCRLDVRADDSTCEALVGTVTGETSTEVEPLYSVVDTVALRASQSGFDDETRVSFADAGCATTVDGTGEIGRRPDP